MRKELDLLLPLLQDSEESRMSGFEFYCGKMGRHDVMVMQCGIGKVNAAMGALMLVNYFTPNFVINSGVAGGADSKVNVMDVVAGARVAYLHASPTMTCGAVPRVKWARSRDCPCISKEPSACLTSCPSVAISTRD